ncbi:hypothetical protein GBAR_LOCUS29216 [Geodia barretti]|uniref:Uncharacterized protein n=1 Tax=Geodia barretti TaxID=519541 RepID=A0AA35TS66_GEOBA|nr:hypothetical protein GBAR_LOCUS29216 [Geodia barretti]
MGLAPAVTFLKPSWMMAWDSTMLVVVPSPAASLVLVAASFSSCAPMFSKASGSSISLAMVTPSEQICGGPNFLSSTTLRPRGPRVILTASASMSMPVRSDLRASSAYTNFFAGIAGFSSLECALSGFRSWNATASPVWPGRRIRA